MPAGRSARNREIADLDTHPDASVTMRALADYVGVDVQTIRKWIDAGALPAYPTVENQLRASFTHEGQKISIRTITWASRGRGFLLALDA